MNNENLERQENAMKTFFSLFIENVGGYGAVLYMKV